MTFVLFTSRVFLNLSYGRYGTLNHHLPFLSNEPHKSFTNPLLHGPNHFQVYYYFLLNWQRFAPPVCTIIMFFITFLHIFFQTSDTKKMNKTCLDSNLYNIFQKSNFHPQNVLKWMSVKWILSYIKKICFIASNALALGFTWQCHRN